MSKFNQLINQGWKQESEIPFREQIAAKASSCYTYSNAKGSSVAIMPVPSDSIVLIRLSSIRGNQFNYFQFTWNGNEDSIANAIDAAKDEADINNYFSFYFSLQSAGEVSIVAWEQWEANYK
jgi:hypothetical protein